MKFLLALLTALIVAVGTIEAQPRYNPTVNKPVVVVRPQVNNYYVLPVYPRVNQNFGFSYKLVNPYYYNPYYNLRPNFNFGYYYGYSFWK